MSKHSQRVLVQQATVAKRDREVDMAALGMAIEEWAALLELVEQRIGAATDGTPERDAIAGSRVTLRAMVSAMRFTAETTRAELLRQTKEGI